MPDPVFVDANAVMYLIGAPHPNRDRAQALLDDLVVGRTRLVTDAEVFQELLWRYSRGNRPTAIADAFETMKALADEVFPVGMAELDAARDLVAAGIGPRDAIHAACMRAHRIGRILTFDTGFDRIPGIERIA